MRELKFRVWDKAKRKMVAFTLPHLLAHYCSEHDYYRLHDTPLYACTQGDRQDCVVMQWTGLQDSQGRDIYEGDIICTWCNHPDRCGTPDNPHYNHKVVRWDREKAMWLIGNSDRDEDGEFYLTEDWLIIGNIFEQPELAKEVEGKGE